MTFEEWYSDFNAIFERLDDQEKNGKLFRKELNSELYNTTIKYWEAYEKVQPIGAEPLKALAEKYTSETFNCLDYVLWMARENTQTNQPLGVPQPYTKQQAERQLTNELKSLDKKHHKAYTEIFWDEFEHEQQTKNFVFTIYHTMKKALSERYFNYLVDLEGDCLRVLDSQIYYMAASEFADEYYTIIEK